MLTWQIDRLLRAGPLCALATLVLPMSMAFLVDAVSDVENVLGIVLVASLIIFLGTVVGSIVASGLGSLLFGLGAFIAEVPAGLLLVVGIGLFTTLLIHDLAGTLRRGPTIKTSVWSTAALVGTAVGAVSTAVFGLTYLVANLATWQSIVVPFGIAAVGFATKLAADSHVVAARQLTAKRTRPSDE